MSSKRTKYDEFYEIGKEKATCKQCGVVISVKGRNTSGMQKHLSKIHGKSAGDDLEDAGPSSSKKSKNEVSIRDHFAVTSKEPLEDLIAREAIRGATFRYLAKSFLVKKGLSALGYQAPNHHSTISKLIDKSAENHRLKLYVQLNNLIDDDQRFCVVTDEWTCGGKRKKYINVTLHLKGMYIR